MKRFIVGALISLFHLIILIHFCYVSILLLYLGSYRSALDLDLSFLACISVSQHLMVLVILKLVLWICWILSACFLHLEGVGAIKNASGSSSCERLFRITMIMIMRNGSRKSNRWRWSWICFSSSGCILRFARCMTLSRTLHNLFKVPLMLELLLNSHFLFMKGFSLNGSLPFKYSLLFLP